MDSLQIAQDTKSAGSPTSHLRRQLCTIVVHDGVSNGELVVHPESCKIANLTKGEVVHVVKAHGVPHSLSDSRASSTPQEKTPHCDDGGNHSSDLVQGRLAFLRVSEDASFGPRDSLQLLLSRDFARALSLRNKDKVWLSKVERPLCATHVEIIIRDEHVTRGDMWRLIQSELAGRPVYKGQRISFLGAVKAQVKVVFIEGKKAQSALFGNTTRPIFRSESAHLTILLQMSKEMWDFDADGSGEIMSSRVLEGFLPELFRRWQRMNVKHLVTIVLFTRMEYPKKSSCHAQPGLVGSQEDQQDPQCYEDFYRVVASALPCKDMFGILSRLRQEFKVFLRDVSLREGNVGEFILLEKPLEEIKDDTKVPVLRGSPSVAVRCNILEAINLALRQHFQDGVVDHDLGRTGISIILISPGTGLYQVKQSLLRTTTDNLIEQGVSIELVCLSRMPLHSVPLFMYTEDRDQSRMQPTPQERWTYSIPRWIDVSYWATPADEDRNQAAILGKSALRKTSASAQPKVFRPRVRLHELQMMGIMENAIEKIALPRLAAPRTVEYNASPQVDLSTALGSPFPHAENSAKISKRKDSSVAATGLGYNPKSQDLNGVVHLIEQHDFSIFTQNKEHSQQQVPASGFSGIISCQTPGLPMNRNVSITPIGSVRQPTRTTADLLKSSFANAGRFRVTNHDDAVSLEATSSSTTNLARKPSGLLRKVSLGPWAVGIGTAKAVASTQITNNNPELATLTARKDRPVLSSNVNPSSQAHRLVGLGREVSTPNIGALSPNRKSTSSNDQVHFQDRSRPIALHRKPFTEMRSDLPTSINSEEEGEVHTEIGQDLSANSIAESDNPSAVDNLASWLTIVNPSNPPKGEARNMHSMSSLGRWQHVFPRPLRNSKMKWKSLCSPAILPITTELFPDPEHLAAVYNKDEYHVIYDGDRGNIEMALNDLLHEMVAVRISQGWQLITKDKRKDFADVGTVPPYIDDDADRPFWLSEGGKVHCLSLVNECKISVSIYTRGVEGDWKIRSKEKVNIRTVLSPSYQIYETDAFSRSKPIDWKYMDQYITRSNLWNSKKPPSEDIPVASVRYVLLPTASNYDSILNRRPSEGDDEEEARIEGIRALSEDWLRYRFNLPDEKGLQSSVCKRKDPNPFDILYQTRNPSEIVTAEVDSLDETEAGSRPVQLLPESELFSRNNINLVTFAQTLQSEKGVSMRDRRWHLRLHHNSFVGFELTTWLVHNFKDVETREEAVDLGNDLMNNGLFEHVQQRHNFRDGNYFYFITNEYRANRPISRGNWFGSLRPSVPSTPAVDSKTTGMPMPMIAPQGSMSEEGKPSGKTTKHRPNVALSKSLLYNVDPRGLSYRPEIIRLHYDRLHNPDNCYHIQVEWLNVTPKLIADAVDRWASTVSQFGLRLVEIPIEEACAISDTHPFRAPYLIKLAKPPPKPQSSQDQSLSFLDGDRSSFDRPLPQPEPTTTYNRQAFHIALLKRFSFILDFEAASSFPSTANVTYSWGPPSYRFPQYVHQSGILVAQITDDGDFLLLANRLHRERPKNIEITGQGPRLEDLPPYTLFAGPSHRALLAEDRGSSANGGSPLTSPRLGAQKETPGPGRKISTEALRAGFGRDATEVETAAEVEKRVKENFEQFCGDEEKLEIFYKEVIESEKNSHKPSNGGNGDGSGTEGEVPTLGLPMRNPRNARQQKGTTD